MAVSVPRNFVLTVIILPTKKQDAVAVQEHKVSKDAGFEGFFA